MSQPALTMDVVVNSQRTDKGIEYDRKRKSLDAKRQARDPKVVALVKNVAGELWRAKTVSPNNVHANTFLTNMSVAYKNDEYIGESLMPIVSVDKRSDQYAIYTKSDRLGDIDDTIGPRGDANEVEENRSSDNYSVTDRALSNYIAAETVDNEDAVFDEMVDLVDAVNDRIALKREMRIATVLTTAANFPGQTATLSGTDQWSSSSGGSPIKNMQDAIASLWQGQGQTDIIGYTSLDVVNTLMRHPVLLDLFKYTSPGLLNRQKLASFFGLSDLLIGAARKNTANKGQTASYSRIWGNDLGIVRVARRPTKRSAHFGSTFQLRTDPMTFQWFDPKKGKAGGHFVKVGLSDDHKIVAADTGYLFKSVIA